MACDAKTLIATAMANGYDALSDRDLKEAIVAAACAGGGGGGGSAYSGYGTLATRNAVAAPVTGMIWTVSDSNPPNQMSVYNGSSWIGP